MSQSSQAFQEQMPPAKIPISPMQSSSFICKYSFISSKAMVAPSQVCPCCGRCRVNSREERLHILQCQQRPLHVGLNARMTNSASPRRWRKLFEATVGRRAVSASLREPLAPRPLPKMAAPRLGCGSAAFLLLAAAVAAWGASSCAGERLRSRFLQCSRV